MDNISTKEVWQWLYEVISQRKVLIVFYMCFALFTAALDLLSPLVWKHLIDSAVTDHIIDNRMVLLLAFVYAVEALPLLTWLAERLINDLRYSIRVRLFKHIIFLSIPFHKDKASTELIVETENGKEATMEMVRNLLNGRIFVTLPVAVGALGYIAYHSLFAGLVLLTYAIVFGILSKILGENMNQATANFYKHDNALISHSRERFESIEAVRLCVAEPKEMMHIQAEGEKILDIEHDISWYWSIFLGFMQLSWVVPSLLMIIVFLPDVASGAMTIGSFMAIEIFATRSVAPVTYIGEKYASYKKCTAKIKPMLQILKAEPSICEVPNAQELAPLSQSVVFDNVTFGYSSDTPILKDLSLQIKKGEKLAIVGPTGAGKTTLARMLARFYDPSSGSIKLDGIDLRSLTFNSLYRELAYVTQDVLIFSGTIAENVGYGLLSPTEYSIRQACLKASAGFVFDKPDGLQTLIGERGEKLSGGERQRLAIARVFLRQPTIVILDEATASLDQATEREVQAAFDDLLQMNGGTTMLVIAHRLTTIRNADRIAVMDQGKIVSIGTHHELIKKCKLYQKLNKQ